MLHATYPAEIEAYWLAAARAETRGTADRDVLRRILPDILRLADRFTVDRPETAAAPYLRDGRACAAYSLYFAPQTHARLVHVLADLPPFADTPQPLRILDLGAGTGAASWALLDHLGDRPCLLTAWDHSRPALRALHEAFSALRRPRWPQAMLRTTHAPLADFAANADTFDVVLLHYVLNEMLPAERRTLLSRAARSLAPGGRIVLCEPLLRAEGDYLRELREYAVGDLGLALLAPCPHALACPLPEACHAVRTWTPPRTLQILNATLRRDLRHLAFAPLVFARPPHAAPAADGFRARIVVPPAHAKGHSICPACCPDGHVHRLQFLHRDFDAAGRKALRHAERGQALACASIEPLGDPGLFRAHPLANGAPPC